jgi:hypothetical protein
MVETVCLIYERPQLRVKGEIKAKGVVMSGNHRASEKYPKETVFTPKFGGLFNSNYENDDVFALQYCG